MGVHQDRETYLKIKELLGIPLDEPIFIFRAQDKFSVNVLEYYRELVHDRSEIGREGLHEWEADLGSDTNDFINWQRDNRDKVKVPD